LSSLCHYWCLLVASLPPGSVAAGSVAAGAQSDAVGNAVQPACQGILLTDGIRLAGEDNECGLESVLGILVARQRTTTDIPDQPFVPAQQHRKRLLTTPAQVEVKKLPVGQVPDFLGIDQVANVLQDGVESVWDHVRHPTPPDECGARCQLAREIRQAGSLPHIRSGALIHRHGVPALPLYSSHRGVDATAFFVTACKSTP
jgi:hypothetical protein